MEPHSDNVLNVDLSLPRVEQGPVGFAQPHTAMRSPEAASLPGELPPIAPPMPAPIAATHQAPAATAPPIVPVSQPAVATATAPPDDTSDDLDQEWVHKAKAIVEKTKHDPHLESNELSKVKADYLKIRYNKQLKVAEPQSQ